MMDPNHIRLAHTGTMVTTVCNLNCKLCCVGTPRLFADGKRLSFERLIRTYDKYFQVVEHVGKFSLGGGEPLLQPKLAALIEHIMRYREKFDVLEVITNGTLKPPQELIDVMSAHKDKVTVLIDKYGDLSPLADQVGEIFTMHEIPNQVRNYYGEDCHCGGWVDLGDFSLKHPEKEKQTELFKRCAYYTGTTKIGICACDGLLYTCGRAYLTLHMGLIRKEPPYFVDLLDPAKTITQLQEEFVDLLNLECPSACAYCNGMCEDSVRYIPAEQQPRAAE